MTQQPIAPVNPQGHSQAANPAGKGYSSEVAPQFAIGAFNAPGGKLETTPATTVTTTEQVNANATAVTTTPETTIGTQAGTRQLTEKDERHFTKFVTKTAQEKYDIARLAVEADENAIFKIAETDKDLAERLIKEYDFGTDNVDELLEKKAIVSSANPAAAEKEIQDAKWKQNMEKQLMEEKILRLKGENADLDGEVEDAFRDLYSNPAMSKFDENQKLAMARAIVGKASTKSNADDVALAVLKQQEGSMSSPKTAVKPDKTKSYSPEFKQMQKAMGVSDKDLELLPENIEELIAQQLGTSLSK